MAVTYVARCFNCLSEFDAAEAIWCSCNPQQPTKVCPFCLGCFCAAGEEFREAFWDGAPPSLIEELGTLSRSRMLLGEMLVRAGLITTGQLLDALNRQKQDDRRLGEILVETGAINPEKLETFIRSQHTVTTVDVNRARIDALVLRQLGVERCLAERILPLEAEAFRDRQIMTLAMADPSNTAVMEWVAEATGYQVIPGVAPAEEIDAVIRSIFPRGEQRQPAPAAVSASSGGFLVLEDPSCLRILEMAQRRKASHVHIECREGGARLLIRIDGLLYHDRARTPTETAGARDVLRALLRLDGSAPASRRVGRATVRLDDTEQTMLLRWRSGPDGGDLCIKPIDPIAFPPHLEELGLPGEVLDRLRISLDQEHGLIIVATPPYSGASSVLYATAVEIASQGRPLGLVESPRAVGLHDAVQEEFFPEIPRAFADAMMRASDGKNRVLVATAAGAAAWDERASDLPGRTLVVCRVEATSFHEALLRLAAQGYPAPLLATHPTLVLHQRLVRRVCPSCRARTDPRPEDGAALGLKPEETRRLAVWRGAGCDDCRATPGYRGRVPLARALRVDARIAEAVAASSLEQVAQACRDAGVEPLRSVAIAAVSEGLTTPEEAARRPPA